MISRLKEIREKSNISQEKLARMTELSRATIVKAENGNNITLDNAFKIARALNAEIRDIFCPN